jgi:hypothetical protein
MSEAIGRLLELARTLGLESEAADWSKARVHQFDAPMTHEMRVAGHAEASLDYFRQDSDAHYAFDEGFVDKAAGVAVSFPVARR